jgi:probable HAF family extracellular repeat protein
MHVPSGDLHAYLWTSADGMTDLGTLGGRHSIAVDINDAGQVIGNSDTVLGQQHAFFWSQATG